jgi:hypothetical protein
MFHMFKFLRLETHLALYPVYLALCVGLSVLSFYYLEMPARWLMERFHTGFTSGKDSCRIVTQSAR